MSSINRAKRALVAVCTVAALAAGAALVPAASAVVPPRDCGIVKVGGKRYQIKADQIRCRTAKSHSRRYLRSRARPSGYRCTTYGAATKLKFRCSRSTRVFFAIKR